MNGPGRYFERHGVTLAEFLVSSLIFLIVLVSVLTLMPFSAFASSHARSRLQADLVAKSVLDEYRARPFESLAVQGPQNLPSTQVENGKTFTPRLEIRQVTGFAPDKVLEIVVEVRWDEPRGRKNLTRALVVSNVTGI